jgi:APA family basic amino acid/polyamine antiporter
MDKPAAGSPHIGPLSASDISKDGLRVAIGLPSAVMLVIGGMVGVGIFVNPAVVARSLHSPELALTAWVAGGLLALLGAAVYAELAARFPSTGGEYVYLRETYGPLVGFLFGWTTLLVVQAGGMAAVAIVFAKNLNVLAGGTLPENLIVIGALAALAAVNCLGVKSGNGVQSSLGGLKLVAIGALIIAGLFVARSAAPIHPLASVRAPAMDDLKAFGAGMIPVVFSFGGWQTANYVAGEMKDSHRNLGKALVIGVLCVIGVYLLVNIACLRVLGIDALAATLTPASDVLQHVAGPVGAKLAAAAIGLSAIAFLSQSTLTGPRVYFAMARDGLFFRKVAEVAEGSRAPAIAIVLQAAWTGVLALSGSYEQILSYVIAMNFLFFGLSASCVFVLKWREAKAGTPHPQGRFKTPYHPFTTGLFILGCIAVVASSFWSYPINSLIGYAIMALGVPPYLFWRRRGRLEAMEA